jgi:uncharacterized coiled-coil protein SlyX
MSLALPDFSRQSPPDSPPEAGELNQLRARLAALEAKISDLIGERSAQLEVDVETVSNMAAQLRRFTDELFDAESSIDIDSDPETNQNCFVVHVATAAEVADIVRLNNEWHRRLIEVAGSAANSFRLSLEIT